MADITLHLTRNARLGKRLPSAELARQVYLLIENGLDWDALPQDMRGCVWLERYAGDVANGGHSQFIANANAYLDDGAGRGLQWVIEGAHFAGFAPLANLAQQCLDWIDTNSNEATDQTGATGGRASDLDPLDKTYLQIDRGDADAFRAALAGADPDIAGNLTHALGDGSDALRYTPLHSVALQLALIARTPVQVVTQAAFDRTVLAQIEGTGVARIHSLKKARRAVIGNLPGPWFCAALLAVADSLPKGARIETWGDEKLSGPRPHNGKDATLRVIGEPARKITLEGGVVTVHASQPVSPPVLVTEISGVPPTRGFFAKRRQHREIARQIKAENDRRIADHAARQPKAWPEVSSPLATGQALYETWRDLHLAEALVLLGADENLQDVSAVSLLQVELGDAPHIEWTIWFGHGQNAPSCHVTQTQAGVTLRLADRNTTIRHDVEKLRDLSVQMGG